MKGQRSKVKGGRLKVKGQRSKVKGERLKLKGQSSKVKGVGYRGLGFLMRFWGILIGGSWGLE